MGIFDLFEFFQLPARLLTRHDASSYTTSVDVLPCTKIAPPSPMHTPHLPLEIVIHILALSRNDADHTAGKRTLLNCALVRKDWSIVAQELLFQHVRLRTGAAAQSFMAAASSESSRGRLLASFVRRLHCVLDDKQPHGLSQESFSMAVKGCPNLRSLSIAFYGIRSADDPTSIGNENHRSTRSIPASFDESVLSVLHTGPRISALHFDNWSSDQEALSRLLRVMPSITLLSIGGQQPSLPSPSCDPLPLALQELRLNFQTSPSTEFMKWLLHNSKNTLRSLKFQRDPSSTLLDYLLVEHCATLEALALPTCASHEASSLLACCARLRELRLENAWLAPGVCREFPKSLERLALTVSKDTALQPVIKAIRRSASMSAVTLHVWPDGERHSQLSAIRIACAIRGVQLNIIRDIHAFRTVECECPVRSGTFCSTKSMK